MQRVGIGYSLKRTQIKLILKHIGLVVRISILDTEVDGSNPSISMSFPSARDFIRIASVDSAVK